MKLSEINKLAKDNVVKLLKDNGFKRQKVLYYYKLNENGIHNFVFFNINYGANTIVTIGCHTEEMDILLGSNSFPKKFSSMISCELSPDSPVEYGVGHLWSITNNDEALSVLSEIETLLQEKAFPFFEKMNHKSKLIDFFPRPNFFDGFEGGNADVMRKIIENGES